MNKRDSLKCLFLFLIFSYPCRWVCSFLPFWIGFFGLSWTLPFFVCRIFAVVSKREWWNHSPVSSTQPLRGHGTVRPSSDRNSSIFREQGIWRARVTVKRGRDSVELERNWKLVSASKWTSMSTRRLSNWWSIRHRLDWPIFLLERNPWSTQQINSNRFVQQTAKEGECCLKILPKPKLTATVSTTVLNLPSIKARVSHPLNLFLLKKTKDPYEYGSRLRPPSDTRECFPRGIDERVLIISMEFPTRNISSGDGTSFGWAFWGRTRSVVNNGRGPRCNKPAWKCESQQTAAVSELTAPSCVFLCADNQNRFFFPSFSSAFFRVTALFVFFWFDQFRTAS